MHIAVIGSGNVGGALAKHWAKKGHQVHLGVKDVSNFKGQALLSIPNISAHAIADAVKLSEVVVLAVMSPATAEVVQAMGDVTGKVIIDTMNSVRAKPEGYSNSFEALLALTKGAEVVKCFNTTGFENMANPVYELIKPVAHTQHLDMFMAGDSKRGKEVARQLALDCGFEECYDFGGNDKVVLLEQFALAWINLAIMQGQGRNIAFKLLKRA